MLISRNIKIGEQIIVHIIMNGDIFQLKYVIYFKEIVEESYLILIIVTLSL